MGSLNLKSEHWAYDLSKDIISKGEIFDQEVISQSIELILTTFLGERLFNPSFGSELPKQIFETMDNLKAEKLIDEILQAIELYEPRIIVDNANVQFKFSSSQNTLEISIPYMVIKQKIVSFFNKKISI